MNVIIERLEVTDCEKLFEFELDNRSFFEEMVPSRGEDFYHFETFMHRFCSLLDEQEKGISYFYLIKDKEGNILGRINLTDIDCSQHQGEIGYRVGEAYTGKGIASRALQLMIEEMSKHRINTVSAKTTSFNIASQRVLEKNGFKRIATSQEEFIMNGLSFTFLYFVYSKVTT